MRLKCLWLAKMLWLLVCEGSVALILTKKVTRETVDLDIAGNDLRHSRSRLLAGRDGDTLLGIILNETDPGDFLAIGEFEESIYFITNFTLPKVEADAYCQQFGGHLASVVTRKEYEFIVTLRNQSRIQIFWIGIEARAPTTFLSNFFFTDGTTNTSFIHPSGNQGIFPWGVNPVQPNGDGACVLWERLDTFFDRGCINPFNFMCKILFGSDIVPTAAPVDAPTFSPSLVPTRSPFPVLFQREFGNDTFFIPDFSTTQTNARAFCKGMDGDLARITDQTEYEFVKQMIADAGLVPSVDFIWLGIQSSFASSNPANFLFTDGLTSDFRFIHVGRGVFPWGNNPVQPNGDGSCVVWERDNTFYDKPCSGLFKFLCRSSGPLPPTEQPTSAPTSLLRFSIGSSADSDFFLIEEYMTQESASERCSQEDSTAALAEIRDIDEYTVLRDQIGLNYMEDLWLIYVLDENLGGDRFSVVNPSSQDISFLETNVGSFPWAVEQPDFDGTCTVWRLDSGFYDRDCSQTNYILCRSGIASQVISDGDTSSPQALVLGLIFGLGGIVIVIIGTSLCFRHYRSESNRGLEANTLFNTQHARIEQRRNMSTELAVVLPESQIEGIGNDEIPMAAYTSEAQPADITPHTSTSL